MQSGIFVAEAEVFRQGVPEARAWQRYEWRHRKRVTAELVSGLALRGLIESLLRTAALSRRRESARCALPSPVSFGSVVRFRHPVVCKLVEQFELFGMVFDHLALHL